MSPKMEEGESGSLCLSKEKSSGRERATDRQKQIERKEEEEKQEEGGRERQKEGGSEGGRPLVHASYPEDIETMGR